MTPKVNVCVPAKGAIPPDTAFSLVALVLESRDLVRDLKGKFFIYVDQARNELVRDTLADPECTHLLGLDADMTWPPDLLRRLLARGKPVVGANYFRKVPPYDTVAGMWADSKSRLVTPLARLDGGLHRVGALGMGATLIETWVLRDMARFFGDEKWFRSEEGGEDLWFFDRLRQMGVPVFLDEDVVCEHLVQQSVTDDHWRATRALGPLGAASMPEQCNFSDLYSDVVRDLPPAGGVVVEVGSFLGASAIVMAQKIRESGKQVRFCCVDHFRGSADFNHQILARQTGGNFRSVFEENLKRHGVREYVEVIEGDSADSASRFGDYSCDFVFIDAEHTEDAVRKDVTAWLPKVKMGGTLAGHDMDWDSVRRAVTDLLPDARPTSKCSWIYRRPS